MLRRSCYFASFEIRMNADRNPDFKSVFICGPWHCKILTSRRKVMGSKKKKKGKGKGKGKGGDPQDPVVLIVSRECAETLYKILPSLYACIPDLYQALALSLGIGGSSMKEKK